MMIAEKTVEHTPVFRKRYLTFALTVGLLLLFLHKAEWTVMRSELRTAEWALLAAAVVTRFIGLLSASLRWQVLLLPVKQVALAPLFSAMLIGISADTLIAMQSAEVIRPYLLSRWENLPLGATLATVMVEWLVDLLAVLTLLIVALRDLGTNDSGFQFVRLVSVVPAAIVAALVGLALLWLVSRHATGIERFLSRRHPVVPHALIRRLAGWTKSFGQGLEILQQPKRLIEISLYSLMSSLLVGVSSWLVLRAFGLPLPFFASLIVLGFVAIGGLVPTPGAVGGFHAACQFGLAAFFQIDPARTILPVIGLHAVLYLPPTLVGVLCINRKHVTFRKIREGAVAAGFERLV